MAMWVRGISIQLRTYDGCELQTAHHSSAGGNKLCAAAFSAEGEAERVMRIVLLVLVVFAAGISVEKSAQAQGGGWCADLNMGGHGGARNCGFATLQQCLATVSGIGGSCSPSPYYEPPNYGRYRPVYP